MSDRKNTPPEMRKPLWPRVWPGRWTASTWVPPEIPHVPVAEAFGVGPRGVVELLDDLLGERPARLAGQPVDVHQPVEAARPGQVGVVDVQPRAGEQPVAGHVVLVAVRDDHGVDRRPAPRPLATTVTDGSMITASPSPRTTSELPDG